MDFWISEHVSFVTLFKIDIHFLVVNFGFAIDCWHTHMIDFGVIVSWRKVFGADGCIQVSIFDLWRNVCWIFFFHPHCFIFCYQDISKWFCFLAGCGTDFSAMLIRLSTKGLFENMFVSSDVFVETLHCFNHHCGDVHFVCNNGRGGICSFLTIQSWVCIQIFCSLLIYGMSIVPLFPSVTFNFIITIFGGIKRLLRVRTIWRFFRRLRLRCLCLWYRLNLLGLIGMCELNHSFHTCPSHFSRGHATFVFEGYWLNVSHNVKESIGIFRFIKAKFQFTFVVSVCAVKIVSPNVVPTIECVAHGINGFISISGEFNFIAITFDSGIFKRLPAF